MGLVRLLLLALLVWIIWRLIKHAFTRPTAAPSPSPESMVKCHLCGVHAPHSTSFHHQGRTFCCIEHQKRWLEQPRD